MLEIGASVVFSESGHVVENGAIGKHSGQADAVSVHRVVTDELNSTSISGQVATDEARALGSEVNRNFIASHLSEILNVTEDAARLSRDDTVGLIEANDSVHALGVDNDFIVDRHGASNEASTATLRDYCQLSFITVGQKRTDLLGALRLQHDL